MGTPLLPTNVAFANAVPSASALLLVIFRDDGGEQMQLHETFFLLWNLRNFSMLPESESVSTYTK